MKFAWGIVLLGVVLAAAPASAGSKVIADMQVIDLAPKGVLLRVRSTEPQAFDVVSRKSARILLVRLYAARVGSLAPLGPSPFGQVKLRQKGPRMALLRIRLRDGWRARVQQGGTPETVDIFLAH